MKKLTLILVATVLVLGAHTANAQVLQSSGSDTTNTSGSGGSVISGQIPCSPACTATQTCNPFGVCIDNTPLQSAGNPSVDSSQTSSGSNTQTSGFVPLAPIPNLTDNVNTSNGLSDFLNQLYKYLIGLAAVIAVIEIIYGGLEYATQDSISKKSDGQHRITQAVLGLVLVLSPALVFSIINPSILNLSLNLQSLNTTPGITNVLGSGGSQPGTGGGSGGSQTPSSACPASCTCTGTLLKKATCQTQADAQQFATACTSGSGTVSSSLFSSNYTALCETTSGTGTGPFAFLDTSQSTGAIGIINNIVGYSHYEPIASSATNANNGNNVVQFAATCTTDGGTTCMSAVKLPIPIATCTFGQTPPANPQNDSYCWAITLSCTNGRTGAGECSSSPNFTILH